MPKKYGKAIVQRFGLVTSDVERSMLEHSPSSDSTIVRLLKGNLQRARMKLFLVGVLNYIVSCLAKAACCDKQTKGTC